MCSIWLGDKTVTLYQALNITCPHLICASLWMLARPKAWIIRRKKTAVVMFPYIRLQQLWWRGYKLSLQFHWGRKRKVNPVKSPCTKTWRIPAKNPLYWKKALNNFTIVAQNIPVQWKHWSSCHLWRAPLRLNKLIKPSNVFVLNILKQLHLIYCGSISQYNMKHEVQNWQTFAIKYSMNIVKKMRRNYSWGMDFINAFELPLFFLFIIHFDEWTLISWSS